MFYFKALYTRLVYYSGTRKFKKLNMYLDLRFPLGEAGKITTQLATESLWVFVRYLKVDTVVIPAFSANGDWYLT
jgi:hypothetical protein